MHVHVLQHVEFEDLGSIKLWLEKRETGWFPLYSLQMKKSSLYLSFYT